MRYFDTHAHYNDEVYKDDLDKVLEECRQKNVEYIVNVGYNVDASKHSIELSHKYDYIYAAIGIHPSDVDNCSAQEIMDLYEKNKDKKIVAIGEIGLDYAYTKENKEEQKKLFVEQIELANALKLPVLIHSRDASEDTYRVLKTEKLPEHNLLFHCFQPSDDLVRLALERNYTVAFGGNVTFPRNESFRRYIEQIPIDNIVIETDAPYLSPVPLRGKRNTSANLDIICAKLAEYKGMEVEFVAERVFENSLKFFNIK